MAIYKGIDVSVYQGNIDFTKVKDAGIDFVIIRAGYGQYSNQIDPKFKQNYKRAKKAGLKVGAYWYSYATTSAAAEKEAEVFINAINGLQFEYPIALDIEDSRQVGLSTKTINSIVNTFCSYCENKGYFVSLYSYENFLVNKVSKATRDKYSIWCANTSNKPTIAADIWQFSFKGGVSGITGDVDMDYSYKDFESIIKRAGLNGFTKEDASKKTEEPVKETTPEPEPKEPILYIVCKGDTLTKISAKFGVAITKIAKDNNIRDVNMIYVGQRLYIYK